MKLFLLSFLLFGQCMAQTISPKEAKKFGKEISSIIKKHSVFRDSLDFDAIEKDFEQHIDTLDTYKKVGYYYTGKLRKAGDWHSFYVTQTALNNFSQQQKEKMDFSFKLMEGDIGYLDIPGFFNQDIKVVNDFANRIQNAIRELDSKNTLKGWIIDLRNNSGGDMWPMVVGLNPLIGINTTPGYFKKAGEKEKAEDWQIGSPHNKIVIDQPYQLKTAAPKIAVLYSKKTASSGEMTAICFIGLPNTKSFGENTAGLTTANRMFDLGNDNLLVLASSYSMDRNKKIYSGTIVPDVPVENNDSDAILQKASGWLKE